jgi:hypothetical protein
MGRLLIAAQAKSGGHVASELEITFEGAAEKE